MRFELQEALRPILLRRMKEDVEDLPEKEEVIVWVRLTTQQHAYYKAIYQNQAGFSLHHVSFLFGFLSARHFSFAGMRSCY